MVNRFASNPIITKHDIAPSQPDWNIECVMNPGVFTFNNKVWLLLRVAERPPQKEGIISFPIYTENGDTKIIEFSSKNEEIDFSDPRKFTYRNETYLTTISHLRLMCSDDGVVFYEPKELPSIIKGHGKYETYGIEDCRVTNIDGVYHLTFTQVSENGVGVGLRLTTDWINFQSLGMIFPPHNKDCAIFDDKIRGQYFCLHRPSGIYLGGNYLWIASSEDLIHWGNYKCIMKTRPGMWDSERIGAGASPIKTDKGWLEIYHAADDNHRYCLGAVLLDIKDPSIVLARSEDPIFEPTADYEKEGFFGNVVFTNGHVVDGDKITLYYGASDEVICAATLSVQSILSKILSLSVIGLICSNLFF